MLNVSARNKWGEEEKQIFFTPMVVSNFYLRISSYLWLNHFLQVHFHCGYTTEFTPNAECSEFTCICILLQEKYQKEQDKLKEEWEKAQREVEEEERRYYEEV